MCQIDVLYGKSLIIDFLDNFLKKRTAIRYLLPMYYKLMAAAPIIERWLLQHMISQIRGRYYNRAL